MDEEALLSAIRRATDDDGPRLVYADWLLEHESHSLGEYITLECAAQSGELLLERHEREWLGAVAEVTIAPRRWTRGLPHRVSLTIGADLRPAIGDFAWRRVQRVEALGEMDVEQTAALLGDRVLGDLHELVVVDEVLAALGDATPDVERLLVFAGPRRSSSKLDFAALLRPRLRRAYVNIATRPADFASMKRPALALGVAHTLVDIELWRRVLEESGAVFARLDFAGRHGFSRAYNVTPLETTLRRDADGRWTVLEIGWGAGDNPAIEELLDGLERVPPKTFTRVTTRGPVGYPWLERLRASLARVSVT